MLVKIFKSKYKINYSKGNYNSLIGLPVNTFEFTTNADYTIVEMGASKPGEIDKLCKIIRPDFSIITNIHQAHIGNFNSFNDLVKTKTAIYRNTASDGFIFVNHDDLNILKSSLTFKNTVSFSFEKKKTDFYSTYKSIKNKIEFLINGQKIYNKNLNEIMAKNILASYAIASSRGISHNKILDCIQKFDFLKGRGQLIKKNGYLIVDDTYNANFESFKAGINSFMNLSHKGRKILVIGDMKELGDKAKDCHISLGNYINDKSPDIVYTFGDLVSYATKQILNKKITLKHFNQFSKMIDKIKSTLIKGDAIYFKASRTLEFEKIINTL